MMDLHTHLDLYPDALSLVRKVNVTNSFTLCMTTSPSAWVATARVFSPYSHITVALGLHPEIVGRKIDELDFMIQSMSCTRFIGEIGLDGSPQYRAEQGLQRKVLESVLCEASRLGNKILSLHSRRAVAELLVMLDRYKVGNGAILHWFSGTQNDLKRAIAIGCYFSVNELMARSEHGMSLIAQMPHDRVLPESDGPFAMLSGKPLSPMSSSNVAQAVSHIWKMHHEDVEIGFNEALKKLLVKSGCKDGVFKTAECI